MKKRREPFLDLEFESGVSHIAGVDEAGRGCLAGPLAIGMTVFTREFFEKGIPEELSSVDDSKKLSPASREAMVEAIRFHSVFSCVVHISNKIIDRIGINPSTEYGILRALFRAKNSGIEPEKLFLDGNFKFKKISEVFPGVDYQSIKGGDSKVFSIAASSILAKVTRDARMQKYNQLYPGYHLDRHKGYGTELHRDCIKEMGASPIHRRSYSW